MSEIAEENSVGQEVGQVQEGEDVDSSPSKKETFQWNTPADEFAEDVASDIDEKIEDENAVGDHANRFQTQIDNGFMEEGSHFSEISNGQINVVNKQEAVFPSKKPKSKNKFPCPKCNKVWNWPWELRRHLVMHFKEVSTQNFGNI